MSDIVNTQENGKTELPTPKQFRANLKEIFDSETTFGSAKAARLELLDAGLDIIREYIEKGCKIVFIHGRLKEAGYTGSRKELSEWLVAHGLWTKREASQEEVDLDENSDKSSKQGTAVDESVIDKNSEITASSKEKHQPSDADKKPDKNLGADSSPNINVPSAKPAINAQNNCSDQSKVVQADKKGPTFIVHNAQRED